MQNTKHLLTSLTFVGLLALAGCSFPGVYKIDIQQGNVVTQDMIDQLRPGMTRRQVRFIMGNPLLVDTFHANRWDYDFRLAKGNGEIMTSRVSDFFKDDLLDHVEGGENLPTESEYLTLITDSKVGAKASFGADKDKADSEVKPASPVAPSSATGK